MTYLCEIIIPAEFGSLKGVPKSICARFGSISVFRTQKYHQIAQRRRIQWNQSRGLKPRLPETNSFMFLTLVSDFSKSWPSLWNIDVSSFRLEPQKTVVNHIATKPRCQLRSGLLRHHRSQWTPQCNPDTCPRVLQRHWCSAVTLRQEQRWEGWHEWIPADLCVLWHSRECPWMF